MADLPADIGNQVLLACGSSMQIADLEDGTREARVLLVAYNQCLRQLTRAANWSFARKTAPLQLLADASGQNNLVGSLVPTPWQFLYQYPVDCMKARFVPSNGLTNPPVPPGNIAIPSTPLYTGFNQDVRTTMRPARFCIATDYNYPPQYGNLIDDVQGVSPQGRTVVLTNVPRAYLVYTALMLYPQVWDPLFRAALVSYIAAEVILAISEDKKFALEVQPRLMEAAKSKVTEARIADGNEGDYTTSHEASWISARASWGRNGYGYAGGAGFAFDGFYGTSDDLSFGGSAY